ncbi:MAG: hypothetical protein EOO01_39140 [Chitinophagaceae bacterium]|nr:MAG: hypothetical protein EOO01_39140 [Chitinophagaceae bacterium]
MRQQLVFLFILSTTIWMACNNPQNGNAKTEVSATADSLKKDLDDAHNVGMAKMGKLTRAEQEARRLLDSIQRLPAKARQAAAPLQVRLDSLQKELQYAEFAMEKWMKEFKWDSTFKDIEQKVDYYQKEKLKVSVVKENILKGIEKADSVLKANF